MDLPYDNMILFKDQMVTLRYAMERMEIGDIIEGLHPSIYSKIINVLMINRNEKYRYGVDDKYGQWRMILLPPHPEKYTKPKGHFIAPYTPLDPCGPMKPISLETPK
jgi:hypothetical protein